MTTNKPVKEGNPKIPTETASPNATSNISSSTKTTKATSKKVENKGIFSKIKSFFKKS